jgi:hypothetical protein
MQETLARSHTHTPPTRAHTHTHTMREHVCIPHPQVWISEPSVQSLWRRQKNLDPRSTEIRSLYLQTRTDISAKRSWSLIHSRLKQMWEGNFFFKFSLQLGQTHTYIQLEIINRMSHSDQNTHILSKVCHALTLTTRRPFIIKITQELLIAL